MFRGWQKVSYIEYPGKIATVLFTGGCNFRCPFCYNGGLVLHPDTYPPVEEEEVFRFLDQRKGLIDAVCVTGGEPMLHAPALLPFLEKVKNRGFLVKVDTNGSNYPEFQHFSQFGLVDLWGIDYKLPFSQYALVGGNQWQKDCQRVFEKALLTPHQTEIRTTIYPSFHDERVLQEMAGECFPATHWYWQNFLPQKTLKEEANKILPYPPSLLREWQNRINQQIGRDLVVIRSLQTDR
ncbi:MAG: anaerobic ribonucleoside-triphosphate reductase activating protein [Candidatus Atribacteria bacterium]|nr:anaerobic ribonucleoside-triphosphate reductase activating protein [Candidatus Atribacteria bacterium]